MSLQLFTLGVTFALISLVVFSTAVLFVVLAGRLRPLLTAGLDIHTGDQPLMISSLMAKAFFDSRPSRKAKDGGNPAIFMGPLPWSSDIVYLRNLGF